MTKKVSATFSTLSEMFLKAVELHPKPDAFLSKHEGSYSGLSSEEALGKAAVLAQAFDHIGIRRGDRVAILAENRVEWALTDYALLGLGAAVVPIYPTLLGPDVEWILRDSDSRAVVVSTEAQLRKVLSVRGRLPQIELVVAMDSVCEWEEGVDCWHRMVEHDERARGPAIEFFRSRSLEVRPQDTASIIYTSGTTGQFKGVVLTHANIASNALSTLRVFPLDGTDVTISFLPLCHIFERMLEFTCFWAGVSIGYAESLETLPENILEVRPTMIPVVPRVLEKIHTKVMETVHQRPAPLEKLFNWAIQVGRKYSPYGSWNAHPPAPPLGLRLRHALADKLVYRKIRARLGGRVWALVSGSAPLSREVAEFFYAVGLPVYEGYGLTETSPVVSVNYPGSVKLGTVGRIIEGVEAKLGEETTDDRGHAGREILVRGPNVSPGYYHSSAENGNVFVDGWFRTGDLGYIDGDGFLSITGRKKNLFKTSGGKFVSPEKLENLFQGHRYVAQIVALGDGRRFICALAVPNFQNLEAWARSQHIVFSSREELVRNPKVHAFMQRQADEATALLPPYERIHQIGLLPKEFTLETGELSPSLKIKRAAVEERYRDLIEEIYQRPAPEAHHA